MRNTQSKKFPWLKRLKQLHVLSQNWPDVVDRVSNRTWTRTVNPNEPFHCGEPEPNLNQQNFTSVNLN